MSKPEEIPPYVKVIVNDGDEDHRLLIGKFNSRESAIMFIDLLLGGITRGRFNFLSELNEIQSDAQFNRCEFEKDGVQPFPNKFTMPLSILNLVLKDYNISIKEEL